MITGHDSTGHHAKMTSPTPEKEVIEPPTQHTSEYATDLKLPPPFFFNHASKLVAP